MKKIFVILFVAALLFDCTTGTNTSKETGTETDSVAVSPIVHAS